MYLTCEEKFQGLGKKASIQNVLPIFHCHLRELSSQLKGAEVSGENRRGCLAVYVLGGQVTSCLRVLAFANGSVSTNLQQVTLSHCERRFNALTDPKPFSLNR